MPKLFMSGIILFLLLGAGYGMVQAAQPGRAIPWDCADWQAFAHDDRETAILESLAENRGKTLYCGIDQSDTFAKAETWEAGRDRNERDGTVYYGERGRFRGFIAAQEGWLTDGESGITGQSIAHIFEFPREERKRRRKPKYEYLEFTGTDRSTVWMFMVGPERGAVDDNESIAAAQAAWVQTFGSDPPTDAVVHEHVRRGGTFQIHSTDTELAQYEAPGGLNAWCRTQGYQQVARIDVRIRTDVPWTYEHRSTSSPAFNYNKARKTIRFNSITCRREK